MVILPHFEKETLRLEYFYRLEFQPHQQNEDLLDFKR